MLNDLLSLFFPSICPSCDNPLLKGERILCTFCVSDLPIRRVEGFCDQVMQDNLAGRLKVAECYSFLRFYKGGSVQKLLHKLKYKNRPDIGRMLGEVFGRELTSLGHLHNVDFIIPIPLHPTRQRRRGYNQSEEFAKGLELSCNIPVKLNAVYRERKSESQTYKSRDDRIKNVKGVFRTKNNEKIRGKHILLVDDVFTTGATIDACGSSLYLADVNSISVATISHAVH